jgi:hypothetical protein
MLINKYLLSKKGEGKRVNPAYRPYSKVFPVVPSSPADNVTMCTVLN